MALTVTYYLVRDSTYFSPHTISLIFFLNITVWGLLLVMLGERLENSSSHLEAFGVFGIVVAIIEIALAPIGGLMALTGVGGVIYAIGELLVENAPPFLIGLVFLFAAGCGAYFYRSATNKSA